MNEKSTRSLIFSVFAEKAAKIRKAPAGKGRGAREISESGKVVGTHGGVFVGNLLFRRNYAGAKLTGLTLINFNMSAILDRIIISGVASLTRNKIDCIPGSIILIHTNHIALSAIFADKGHGFGSCCSIYRTSLRHCECGKST